MSKYISVDSQIIYDKFVNNYKNSNKYKLDKNYIKKDNIYITSFSKLFCIYIIICLAILIIVKLSSYKVFGGITIKKLFIIFGAILFIFVLLYILAIIDFTTKKEEYLATLSLWDALSEENILGSKNCLEIIDFLYENNNEVRSFYIKLFNIIKSSIIVGYSKWLITLFIGFYTGILSSIFMKYIDKEAGKDLLNYISLIGKELLSILMIILFFSILYYICIHMVYKDESREHDLYVLSLKKVKYILLQDDSKNEKKYLVKKLKENGIMKKEKSEIKDVDKVNKNRPEEYRNDEQMYLEEKQNNHRKISYGCSYLIVTLSIIFIFASFVYVIIYCNNSSDFIKNPILILSFYIILIFINIMYRILNNGMDLNFKHFKCLSNNFFKDNGLHYALIFLIVVLCSKLLIYLNSKTFVILIMSIVIGNTIKQIRVFLEDYNILEKYKSNRS